MIHLVELTFQFTIATTFGYAAFAKSRPKGRSAFRASLGHVSNLFSGHRTVYAVISLEFALAVLSLIPMTRAIGSAGIAIFIVGASLTFVAKASRSASLSCACFGGSAAARESTIVDRKSADDATVFRDASEGLVPALRNAALGFMSAFIAVGAGFAAILSMAILAIFLVASALALLKARAALGGNIRESRSFRLLSPRAARVVPGYWRVDVCTGSVTCLKQRPV